MKWISQSIALWRGKQAEQQAKQYLLQQGLTWVCSNYRCRAGEIDLIMTEQSTWVFVEVKYRSNSGHGQAVEYFHPSKRKKCIRAMQHYMLQNDMNPASTAHRIDLVAIDGTELQWLKAV